MPLLRMELRLGQLSLLVAARRKATTRLILAAATTLAQTGPHLTVPNFVPTLYRKP
jgi:hypothetical protein